MIDVGQATANFKKRFLDHGFEKPRPYNYVADDYSAEKESRDTQAVKDFLDTELAEHIKGME